MIFDAMVTAAAVEDPTAHGDKSEARERLRRTLEDHAMLVFSTREEQERFAAAVFRLKRDRTRWTSMLPMLEPRIVGNPPPPVIADGGASARRWHGAAELVVVPPATAVDYGVPENLRCWSSDDDELEVVHCDAVNEAHVVERMRERKSVRVNGEGLHAPRTREDLWQHWMLPLLNRARFVTFLDPDFGKEAVEQSIVGFTQDGPTELPWLLNKLSSLTRPPSIKVITARHDESSRLGVLRTDFGNREVTPARIEKAIYAAWETRKRLESWDALGKRPLDVAMLTYARDGSVRACTMRCAPKRSPGSRYLELGAGLRGLRHEDLGVSRPMKLINWSLSYYVGVRQSKPAAENEDALVSRCARQDLGLN